MARFFCLIIVLHLQLSAKAQFEGIKAKTFHLQIGQTFRAGKFNGVFYEIKRIGKLEGIDLNPGDVAVETIIRLNFKSDTLWFKPLFVIKDKMAGRKQDYNFEENIGFECLMIHPAKNEFEIVLYTQNGKMPE